MDLNFTVSDDSGSNAGLLPISAPSSPDNGDVHLEVYDDFLVWWSMTSGAWVESARMEKLIPAPLIPLKSYVPDIPSLVTLTAAIEGHLAYVKSKLAWYIKNGSGGWDFVKVDAGRSIVTYKVNDFEELDGNGIDTDSIALVSAVSGATGLNYDVEGVEVYLNGVLQNKFSWSPSSQTNLKFLSVGKILGGDIIEIMNPTPLLEEALYI